MFKRLWHKFSPDLPPDYEPTEDEAFMSAKQLIYFRHRLEKWHAEIMEGAEETFKHLKTEERNSPDIADRATRETERNLELRERDRQRKLTAKINKALEKIDNGTYGYCEDTGKSISIKRLIARPIATLTLEAQEKHERDEKTYNQD